MDKTDSRGLAAAAMAHVLWGVFPLYFHLLGRAGALEIVAHRIVWTLVFCTIGVTIVGAWAKVREVLRNRRLTVRMLLAGVLVSANWLIYVYAVLTDHVVDAALGYFMNPLVTVCMAMVFLHEKVRRGQAIALVLGVIAVVAIIVGLGSFPWIGLGLAFSFGGYSLIKNRVGARVTPLVGLGVEALALAPLSAIYIVFLQVNGTGTFLGYSWVYTVLLILTGAVTAIPLLFFAVGAARLNLVTLALVQYLTPVIQFLIGVLLFGEHMPLMRWIGFVCIWIALVILTIDMIHHMRSRTPTVE